MKKFPALLLLSLSLAFSCQRNEIPHTERTSALVKELLTKLDSSDVYAARKEQEIEELKSQLSDNSDNERFDLYYTIARQYSDYSVDSTLVYYENAKSVAQKPEMKHQRIKAEISSAQILSEAGYYTEAEETLEAIQRNSLDAELFVLYYNAWTTLYHNLYSDANTSIGFQEKYRSIYGEYRDSLLAVADTMSLLYLHNIERKEARAGNFSEAKRHNDLRASIITDTRSQAYATCLYDRFAIAYLYERELTGEALDDLLESAIIEVENSNRDIASLLRVETVLINFNRVKDAQKVSDHYFSSLRNYGSKKRLIDGVDQTIRINNRTLNLLRRSNRMTRIALSFIMMLIAVLALTLFTINRERIKITRLNEYLKQSGKITKGYVGAVFQLYSSYIKRLDSFRAKIHTTLRKGNIEQALEITSPSEDIAAEERKELFHNFDTAFVDIFPDYIETVNKCMLPSSQIIPKKTEILNTELRILALIKLGIEDSTKIAEMLHCSVKTVYNLRSGIKSRLAIPEEEFKKVISEL